MSENYAQPLYRGSGGSRESAQSWKELPVDLKARGLTHAYPAETDIHYM
jgi:hypothetical protein